VTVVDVPGPWRIDPLLLLLLLLLMSLLLLLLLLEAGCDADGHTSSPDLDDEFAFTPTPPPTLLSALPSSTSPTSRSLTYFFTHSMLKVVMISGRILSCSCVVNSLFITATRNKQSKN
jgi:hypothetical protein